jgi:hypothetical protein
MHGQNHIKCKTKIKILPRFHKIKMPVKNTNFRTWAQPDSNNLLLCKLPVTQPISVKHKNITEVNVKVFILQNIMT